MIICTAFIYFSKDEAAPRKEVTQEEVPQVEAEPEVVVEKPVVPEVSWKDRLTKGLSRSRTEVWGKLEKLFSKDTLDQDTLDEVEELLYSADIGVQTASEIIEALEERSKSPDFNSAEFKSFLKTFLGQILEGTQSEIDPELFEFNQSAEKKPKVIMVVGVNGAGKTTTIGKLATKLTSQGAKVVVGACDTFRAAAVDQLAVWCERSGATMIRPKKGQIHLALATKL